MIDNVNEYSITMDVKFNNAPPDEGFSLFQTALVHAGENKDGDVLISRSNGECHVGNNGGVGILGKYGNKVKSKMKVGKLHRVVISVKCVEMKSDDAIGPKGRGRSKPRRSRGRPKQKKRVKKSRKGVIKIWIDYVPCALIESSEISKVGGFSMNHLAFYLF